MNQATNQDTLEQMRSIIVKKRAVDEKKTKSANNKYVTSRKYYEGKIWAYDYVLSLINEMETVFSDKA